MASRDKPTGAPLLAGVSPTVDTRDVDAADIGDDAVPAALPNDDFSRSAHASILRLSPYDVNSNYAIIAQDALCGLRNNLPMPETPFSPAWFEAEFQRTKTDQAALFHYLRDRLGEKLDRSKVNKVVRGRRQVQKDEIPLVWAFFGRQPAELHSALNARYSQAVDPSEGIRSSREEETPPSEVDFSKIVDMPRLPNFGGPRTVEVKGTAVGGSDEDGDFRFNGETIDRAPLPPGIFERKGVYAIYVENDSMYPRYKPGKLLYVDPYRRPLPDDDVIIELHPHSEGESGRGYIKAFVKRTATKLIVEQFNPPKQIEFDLEEVKSVHRVIPTEELLGI